MKTLIYKTNGEPSETLTLEDRVRPAPGANDVAIRITLAPVHVSDLHAMRGRFGRQPALPAVPGLEGVGEIDAVGVDVTGFQRGDRVVLLDVPGTWSDYVLAPAQRVVKVPANLADEDAAQAFVNPLTALAMIRGVHRLHSGAWLIQTAAGSTIGRLVLQLAETDGFHTINLVRRADQVAQIVALGGDIVICTTDDDWQAQLTAALATSGGAMCAIDCVAGEVGAAVARALAPGGRMLVYGALSSHRQTTVAAFAMPLFTPKLIYSAVTVQGWFLYHWLAVTSLSEARGLLEESLALLDAGTLRLPPSRRYVVDDVQKAMRDAETSDRPGKPLLDFSA